jgi:acetyl-CoA C-acetyltransferase
MEAVEAYIVAAVRTPIGKFGGALKDWSPVDLAASAMRGALERVGLTGSELDLVIFGNVLRGGHGQLVPRQAALKAGLPQELDAFAVDMVCASGMQAVISASTLIQAGEAELVLAGGVESMSQAGFVLSARGRWGYKYLAGAPEPLLDLLHRDGLSDPWTGEAMGEQTERLAAEHQVSRQELDEIAYLSQCRAAEATRQGLFREELVPLEVKEGKASRILDRDEGIRLETTREALAALRPAFRPQGLLTAGNSSQISDGAAALLLASREALERYGLRPLAKVLGFSWSAGEPYRFPEAPIAAVRRLLERKRMSLNDFQLFENNEAFALNNWLFCRQLGVSCEELNVRGGAIAMGHPIGASGARILVTLLHALRQSQKNLGLAAICHGTGGAAAMAIEAI